MLVHIVARHCEITDRLEDRARTVLSRLGQLTPFAQEATVVFGMESQRCTVEIRLRLSGGRLLVGAADAVDHRTALDRAGAKVRRQLERPAAKPARKHRGKQPA
jgi:ribosomal subunit interface protein